MANSEEVTMVFLAGDIVFDMLETNKLSIPATDPIAIGAYVCVPFNGSWNLAIVRTMGSGSTQTVSLVGKGAEVDVLTGTMIALSGRGRWMILYNTIDGHSCHSSVHYERHSIEKPYPELPTKDHYLTRIDPSFPFHDYFVVSNAVKPDIVRSVFLGESPVTSPITVGYLRSKEVSLRNLILRFHKGTTALILDCLQSLVQVIPEEKGKVPVATLALVHILRCQVARSVVALREDVTHEVLADENAVSVLLGESLAPFCMTTLISEKSLQKQANSHFAACLVVCGLCVKSTLDSIASLVGKVEKVTKLGQAAGRPRMKRILQVWKDPIQNGLEDLKEEFDGSRRFI